MDGYFLHVANRLDKIRTGDNHGKSEFLKELKTLDLWRAVLAEFVATMLFVFIGTMSAVGIVTLSTGEAIIRVSICNFVNRTIKENSLFITIHVQYLDNIYKI